MNIHPPKVISSKEGLGRNTSKKMHFLESGVAIGTETWGELEKPWAEGDVVIAKHGYRWVSKWEAGQRYVPTRFLDELGSLIGIYCDVSKPVEYANGVFTFTDLYLDVWYVPGRSAVLLDSDELEEAVQKGYLHETDAHQAMKTAEELMSAFDANPLSFDFSYDVE